MKKISFLIFLFILSFFSNAQDVRFGLTGGGNLCSLYGPDKPDIYTKQYGFSGGLFLDSRIAEHLSTQIEANFTRYRFQFSEKVENTDDVYFNVKEVNDYITVPVMLKYKKGYNFIFYYLAIGGQASVLINNQRDVYATSRNLVIDSQSYYDYKNNWYDYGLNGSIGFQYKPLSIGLQYYASMRSLYTKEDALEMQYNIINLNFSWQFNYRNATPFGRKAGWKGFKYQIKHLFN